jgi:hypothetical protein
MSAMGMGAILQDSIRVRGQCQCVNRAGYKYDEKASLMLKIPGGQFELVNDTMTTWGS